MPDRSTVERVLNRVANAGGRVLSLLTGLLAASLILYSSYVIYDTFYIQNQAFGNGWELLDYRPEIIDDGAAPLSGGDTLASINEDYRAWLTIYDTFIDYPVMQGPNDLYYSSHDIYKNTSLTGALYLATGNSRDFSDSYNLIYGHHMDNSALFGGLDDYLDEAYFNGHRSGILVTESKVFDLQIFAVISTDAYEDMVYNVGNRDLAELVGFIRSVQIHMDDAAANAATQIIAFSTCESAQTNGRLVVFAAMTERNMNPPDNTPVDPENPANPVTPGTPDPVDPQDSPGNVTPGGTIIPDNGTPGAGGDTVIPDEGTPKEPFINRFVPKGGSYGERAWALVNLICVIITIYILIPLQRIKDKVNRAKTMKKLNENAEEQAQLLPESSDNNEEEYKVGRFRTRLIIGFILEILISIAAVVAFILTEDMRLPMILIDKWTPLMLIILAACWVVDLILIRNRKKKEKEEQE